MLLLCTSEGTKLQPRFHSNPVALSGVAGNELEGADKCGYPDAEAYDDDEEVVHDNGTEGGRPREQATRTALGKATVPESQA